MKKNSTNTANTANTTAKKILPIGRKLTEADIQALEMRLAAAEAALATEKAAKAALEAKVKTSAKREAKAPDTYDILQPVFVALRGSINKGIVSNDTIIQIFFDVLDRLKITLSVDISKKLFNKTVLHNSVSNMAKATELKGLQSRNQAYTEMVEQAKVLLASIDDTFWNDCQKAIDTATAKQKTVLKIA